MARFIYITKSVVRLLLTGVIILALSACKTPYDKSLVSQIKDLKQEIAQLQAEKTILTRKIKEAQRRYGIDFDSMILEHKPGASIFERVFSESNDANNLR